MIEEQTFDQVDNLINRAIEQQLSGLHLQARNLFNQAQTIDASHPAISKFIRIRTRREYGKDEYYEEPEVSCCCCPGCHDSLSGCLCKAFCCDLCCIPGGCV